MPATLTSAPTKFVFDLAGECDDVELRALLRRNPMDGALQLTFEREPSFFDAASVQGEFHQVGVCRERVSGRIVGFGARAVSDGFVNGERSPLGYLSDLRLEPGRRGGTLVGRGYRFLRELHADGRAQLYTTVIFDQNETALRTIASGRAGLPTYNDCGRLLCPGIRLGRRKPPVRCDAEVVRGNASLWPQIVACVNRNNRRKQFAPEFRWDDFPASEFFVALRSRRVVGTVARWDQRAFKQTRVHGYRGALRWLWPFVRGLPQPGGLLNFFHASFVAVDDDDMTVWRALLRALYNDAIGGEFSYFVVGLHERDPLASVLEDYSAVPFAGRLFCVCFEDGEQTYRALDWRVPYVEVATL